MRVREINILIFPTEQQSINAGRLGKTVPVERGRLVLSLQASESITCWFLLSSYSWSVGRAGLLVLCMSILKRSPPDRSQSAETSWTTNRCLGHGNGIERLPDFQELAQRRAQAPWHRVDGPLHPGKFSLSLEMNYMLVFDMLCMCSVL